MLHDRESRVIIMKNVEPGDCSLYFFKTDYDDGKTHTAHVQGCGIRGCSDSNEKFLKRDEKNVLDQNVNRNEVKRVIYSSIAKNEDKRQQATIEVADSLIFHSWSNLFRISRRSQPDGTTLILFLLSLLFRHCYPQRSFDCIAKQENCKRQNVLLSWRASFAGRWLKNCAHRRLFVLSASCNMLCYWQYVRTNCFPWCIFVSHSLTRSINVLCSFLANRCNELELIKKKQTLLN